MRSLSAPEREPGTVSGCATVAATAEISAGPMRQQPPTRRAPASTHSRTWVASKAAVPVQRRLTASQCWPLFG